MAKLAEVVHEVHPSVIPPASSVQQQASLAPAKALCGRQRLTLRAHAGTADSASIMLPAPATGIVGSVYCWPPYQMLVHYLREGATTTLTPI